MTAPVILGPDGEPLRDRAIPIYTPGATRTVTKDQALALVRSGQALQPEAVLELQRRMNTYGHLADSEGVIEGHVTGEQSKAIAKTANEVHKQRARGVSYSTVWDRQRGKPKPTPITVDTLRLMAQRSEWVSAIIKTRQNQIGNAKWQIVPKDKKDKSAQTTKACEKMTELLQRPSVRGSEPSSRSWRQFIRELLQDVLVLDAGAIEKERDRHGWIAAMYPVDGGTIRPNINEKGGYFDDAYVQVVDGVVCARFGMEELIYVMDNPQTDVRFAGYGFSPLENLIVSVTADLYSARYNQSYFEKGSVPEGLLNLGEEAAPEDVDAFRLYWMNEIMGRPWAIPIVGGKGVEWIQWRDNNRDMQFMEYQGWLLKKMCAVYQIAPQEIGELEDVNRSTANDQSDVNESKSIEPILGLLKDYIDFEVIGPHGQGLGDWIEFDWEEEGDSAEEVNAKFQPLVEMGGATRKEWRDALGMDDQEVDVDTPGAEGLNMFLTSGDLKPLPTEEDAELLSVSKQQEREDQQAATEQDGSGPGSDMPWKPGSGDDPATRQAMRDHDEEHGIGPRNQNPDDVGKTAPDGRDRAPAVTERQNALIGVFEEHKPKLLHGLAEILGLPEDELEEVL